MKNYAFSFNDSRFNIDIVPRTQPTPLFELLEDADSLYILTPFPDDDTDALKIYYPKESYELQHTTLHQKLLKQFVALSVIAALISLLFATYILKPLRNSLALLETFIKDIIHDLNTPLSSILINLKMYGTESEELKSIENSAKAISMLHQNLNSYLEERHNDIERFCLKKMVEEQVSFFKPMYDYLHWHIDITPHILYTNPSAFSRILYNLISNACKYNIPQGEITIRTEGNILIIENDSYGIKEPDRLFERFYKENDRGLGIGLHIVEKLCDTLDISKTLSLAGTRVTFTLDLTPLTNQVTSK